MKEFVLHYVWQHRLFVQHDLFTTDGKKIEVIDVGKLNMHAGPDFFNAKIKIENTIWAGNVEIHNLSSDWNKHKHQLDANYKNVILHVVRKADVPVFLPDGQLIPQLEISFSKEIEKNIDSLLLSTKWIACEDKLLNVSRLYWYDWKTTLLAERLMQKTHEIYDLLSLNGNNWEETCFVVLAKSFGFSVNKTGFLRMAKTIPWTVLLKTKHNLLSLEALLFGQAGLLNEMKESDDYLLGLKQEYQILQARYLLKPIDSQLWRMLRLRPDNFPYIRISQFASLLYMQENLFNKIIQARKLDELICILQKIKVSVYWRKHYRPNELSKEKDKNLGIHSIYSILINAFLPVIFSYGERYQDDEIKNRALAFIDEIPPENNYITRNWRDLGVSMETAGDTQALIHLFKNYCDKKNCLRCRIGYKLLTNSFNMKTK